MKSRKLKRVEKNIYITETGSLVVRIARFGHRPVRHTFDAGTPMLKVRRWRDRKLEELERLSVNAVSGTLAANAVEYLRDGGPAKLTKATRIRRDQQLEWICAQLAAPGAPVLSRKHFRIEREARKNGEVVKSRGRTLGDLTRDKVQTARLQEIFDAEFPVPDDDPAKYDATYNNYRLAIWHLFVVLDVGNEFAVNPVAAMPMRQGRDPGEYGVDMRIVREILKHASVRPKGGTLTKVRADVLAWVLGLRETQLMKVDPTRDFHDVPEATREDMLAGAITLTLQPHMKGRKGRRIPKPEVVPLNPWAVDAMRVFAATPAAWGDFSMASVNKYIKGGAGRAQAALKVQGLDVDLSEFTAKHLKHSLATTADLASGGLMNRHTGMQIDDGVSQGLAHAKKRTTRIYTQAAVKPKVRRVNMLTTLYLEELFKTPLVAAPLRLVAK